MLLERRLHYVRELGFGPRTTLTDGRLEIAQQGLVDLVLADDRLTGCVVQLASPGESARVVHICDTVEPHWRADGPTFPGWAAEIRTAGDGVTHRLAGVGVTAWRQPPLRENGGLQLPREDIGVL